MAADRINLILLCLLLPCAATYGWQNDYILTPPIGNSLVLKLKTENAKQMFKCASGKWLPIVASADLVEAIDPSIPVGAYRAELSQDQSIVLATWTLRNQPGEIAESGQNTSSVSGKEIVTVPSGGFISEALLQATAHQFSGAASLVSYIQRLFPQGGDPPKQQWSCTQESATIEVPFAVEFWLWKQDLTPPLTPATLSLFNERVVQGFFGEGDVLYRYDGSSWQQLQAQATLYDVPGGIVMGKYTVQAASDRSGGSSYMWQTSIANGFQVIGKDEREPVLVDQNCLAWSLVAVTSYSSNDYYVGPYTHVQIVSTRGGLPLSDKNSVPTPGLQTTSPFSAIFWFYAKSQ